MLDPYFKVIPFAVLGASVLGSGHCVSMCGGLIVGVTRSRRGLWEYHIGRLAGYCLLGAIAGFLGQTFLQSSTYIFLNWLFAFLLGGGFIYFGIQLLRGRTPHLFRLPSRFFSLLGKVGAGMTGLLSAFLPCGWLHIFVLGAIATQSPLRGAVYLFFFWLGTLPALTFGPVLTTRIIQPLIRKLPRVSAVILICLGIGSIGFKMVNSYAKEGKSCHGTNVEMPPK